jgi:hypothetical protein
LFKTVERQQSFQRINQMSNRDPNKRRSLTERIRELLEELSKALNPAPTVPQPIPVRNDHRKN